MITATIRDLALPLVRCDKGREGGMGFNKTGVKNLVGQMTRVVVEWNANMWGIRNRARYAEW